jgi:CBS domain-containing protein
METIKNLMSENVETIHPDAFMRDAASLMKKTDVGALPVYDGAKLKGMLTDRDLVVRGLADGMIPENLKVKDVMTSRVIYAFEDQAPEEAAQLMKREQIRRIPVVNRKKRLVGVLSLADLAKNKDWDLTATTLRKIVRPHTLMGYLKPSRNVRSWGGVSALLLVSGLYFLVRRRAA